MNGFADFRRVAGTTLFLCAACILVAPRPAVAQENGKGYNAFRTVRTRNIFDPQRRAMRTETTTTTVVTAGRRPSFIALTGAMVTDDRALAFFAGSPSDNNKVVRAGDSIADFKVANVTAKGVELARDGKTIALNVGQQIPLEGANAGVPAAMSSDFNIAPSSGSNSFSSSSSSTSSAPSAPGTPSSSGGGDKSEILKRMMERREKEGSK